MNRSSLVNKKLTYGGKGSNWIEFDDTSGQEKVILHVHYIFDRATHEFEDYSFVLTRREFDTLIDDLEMHGSSQIRKEDLAFEWKWNNKKLEFKLDGRSVAPFSGSSRYYLPDFVVIDNIAKEN